jgi:hypothetical protein
MDNEKIAEAMKVLHYEWGWPGPNFRYYLYDYGRTWALTKEEITERKTNDGN